MKFIKFKQFVAGTLMGVMAGAPTLADDTEVFVGLNAGQVGAKPNILLVIDTSASMTAEVETEKSPYDANTTYAGQCAADRIYWSGNGSPPSKDDNGTDSYCFSSSTNKWFYASQMRCDAGANSLAASGFFTDRIARWKGSKKKWQNLKNGNHTPDHVECAADDGIHGENVISSSVYITNGNSGPWQSSTNGALNWNSGGVGKIRTLFSGNYMNWFYFSTGSTSQSRISIVKSVATDLVNSTSGVNLGLMRFDTRNWLPSGGSGTPGGLVLVPAIDIDVPGARNTLTTAVSGLTATSWTPLTQTLYEAMLYYRGETSHHGNPTSTNNTLHSVASSMTNTNDYISPIQQSCGKNFVVLLTDGQPTHDRDDDSAINSLISTSTVMTDTSCGHGPNQYPSDSCLDELAEYMYVSDNIPDDIVDGDQKITTFAVGFKLSDGEVIEDAAIKGGGEYFPADNATSLSTALQEIITDILDVNASFTSPAVAVNAFNRLTHNNELYFTVFNPTGRAHWPGNVKRYAVGFKGLDNNNNPIDENQDGIPDVAILDKNGNFAVNESNGLFADTSWSFWTEGGADGANVELGGFASRLYSTAGADTDPDTRNVYTYTGTLQKDLANSANALHETNAALTKSMFGSTVTGFTDAQFEDLLKWSRGVDVLDVDDDLVTTDGRTQIGAPLHSKPAIVTYGFDDNSTPVTSDDTQDVTMYVITNDGYLHAVTTTDTANASLERFSYVPPNHLDELETLYTDGQQLPLEYGLDGKIEVWINDANGDYNIVNTDGTIDSGEHVYLYFTERRGGKAVHALDVTDRNHPEFKWMIDGDDITDVTDPLIRLGQTWSKPKHRRIQFGGVTKDVLIMGGGYDTGNDSPGAARINAEEEGNAVYILDAETGDVLWWAGKSNTDLSADLNLSAMNFSIAADVTAIDVIGRDGLVDTMFVPDMGGQIWRFDIDNAASGQLSNRITGGVIADMQLANAGDTPTVANNRRFYDAVDVSLAEPTDGSEPFLALAVGSGFRAHPNNLDTTERFYVIKDYDIDGPPRDTSSVITYSKLYESDLLDVTDIISDSAFESLLLSSPDALDNGWYITLESTGEKGVSDALTVNGAVIFTTFIPADQSVGQSGQVCAPREGLGRFYEVNVLNGQPVLELDGVVGSGSGNELTKADRSKTLKRPGIPPDAVTILPDLDGVNAEVLIGNEFTHSFDNPMVRTYWYQDNVLQ